MPMASKEHRWGPGVHRRHPRLHYKQRDAIVADLHPWLCVPFDGGLPPRPHNNGLAEEIAVTGVQEPVMARPDPHHPGRFEIILGRRQLEAVRTLKLNDTHSLALRARVMPLTDEEAFTLAMSDMASRTDLKPIDVGRTLWAALVGLFNYNYLRMGRLLGMAQKEMRALIDLGRLPSEIIAAVGDPGVLTPALVEPLAFRMRTANRRAHVLARAADIADEQAERRRRRRKLRSATDVLDDLCEQIPASEARPSTIDVQTVEGKVIARVVVKGEGMGSIDLIRQKGVPSEDRHAALLRAVDILQAEVDRPFRFRR